MRPTDKAYRYLLSTWERPHDPVGNRQRRKLLERVAADSDGCWIWQGGATKVAGRHYPRISVAADPRHPKRRWLNPLLYLLEQWAPTEVPPKRTTYRLCGKTLCIRPSCATVKQTYRPLPESRVYQLRVVERLPLAVVAELVGMSHGKVTMMCYRRGWTLERRHTPIDADRMAELVGAGLSIRATAAALSCDRSTVTAWRRKLRGH